MQLVQNVITTDVLAPAPITTLDTHVNVRTSTPSTHNQLVVLDTLKQYELTLQSPSAKYWSSGSGPANKRGARSKRAICEASIKALSNVLNEIVEKFAEGNWGNVFTCSFKNLHFAGAAQGKKTYTWIDLLRQYGAKTRDWNSIHTFGPVLLSPAQVIRIWKERLCPSIETALAERRNDRADYHLETLVGFHEASPSERQEWAEKVLDEIVAQEFKGNPTLLNIQSLTTYSPPDAISLHHVPEFVSLYAEKIWGHSSSPDWAQKALTHYRDNYQKRRAPSKQNQEIVLESLGKLEEAFPKNDPALKKEMKREGQASMNRKYLDSYSEALRKAICEVVGKLGDNKWHEVNTTSFKGVSFVSPSGKLRFESWGELLNFVEKVEKTRSPNLDCSPSMVLRATLDRRDIYDQVKPEDRNAFWGNLSSLGPLTQCQLESLRGIKDFSAEEMEKIFDEII